MKNGQQWFQKLMQCFILITGLYIIYRGSGILAETGWLQRIFYSDKTAQVMQEVVVNTYLPGYVAALRQVPDTSPLHQWMKEIFPVLERWYEQVQEGAEKQKDYAAREGAEKNQENAGGNEAVSESGNEQVNSGETEGGGTEQRECETLPAEENTETAKLTEAVSEEALTETDSETVREVSVVPREELEDFSYLLNHYFVVDQDTVTDEAQLNAENFLSRDLSIEKNSETPQILIYHTHSQETFLDSVEGDTNTSIIGIGDYLASLLEEKYGYQVIHDTGVYDLVDGVLDRSAAYDYARAAIQDILEEHPTIEVIIDLHRDGVEGYHFVTEIDGKPTAQIMFFNGLSKNSSGQTIDYLYNPYIEENLAFSFQLQMAAERDYPGFTRNIYLKGQRFNLHLRPRSLLIEAGTQLNTVEEEKNAMEPLADMLNQVLSGEGTAAK